MYRAEKSGLAADIQQKRFETYPKQDEKRVIQWMEDVLGEEMDCNFYEWLRDGSVICRLFNEIEDDNENKIPAKHCKASTVLFKQLENIGVFLNACKKYGLSQSDCFVSLDLHELNDLAQVLTTIFALDRKAHKKGWDGPTLSPKEADHNKREFTDKQLRAGAGMIPLQSAYLPGASQKGMAAPGSDHYKHAKLTKAHSHSTGYKSSSSTTNSNQLSAAFSDHLRITPVRSAPHSPADGDLSYLHVRSEPTFDKQRRVHYRKSPDRMTSREKRCTTPNSFVEKRAISLEYIDKKQPYASSSSLQLSNRHRTASLHPILTCNSPCFSPPHSQTSNHFIYPHSIPKHTRPAPDPPSECLYENVENIYPMQGYTHSCHHVDIQDNIYMNAPGLDANGKPSLVPSIMTMQDRILLMDKDPVHFPHSYSDLSIGQTSSLGDLNSVSEFNQYHQKHALMKEDMV
ncbi:Muscle-specific protein 20-like isoform X2 [Oopsacas minuta]|uniref:Muscle-specific protein 20-like isoform X2 n=1 Tax=Oopsacas minuta TaxID=111878 RepID=A0AAV7K2S9_9METZ|nr:Muscle-specific protein 20-like isoform X2 [Oopsacas minuta]